MSKHPDWEDDKFDDFIRRSVEEPQIPFDPKAWQAMEQKLDAAAGGQDNAGKGGSKGGRIAGLIIGILLLSGLSWFLLSGEGTSGNGKQENEQAFEYNEGAATAEEKPAMESLANRAPAENAGEITVPEESDSQSSSTAAAGASAGEQDRIVRKSVENDGQNNSQKLGTAEKAPAEDSRQREAVPGAEENKAKGLETAGKPLSSGNIPVENGSGKVALQKTSFQAGGERKPTPAEAGTEKAATSEAAAKEREVSAPVAAIASEASEVSASSIEASNKQALFAFPLAVKKGWLPFVFGEQETGQLPIRQEEKEEAIVLPSTLREGPFSLSLTLAPDFTGTGQKGSMKMGAGFGLHLEYKIRQRFSIVSGVFYSKKNYLADNSFSPYGKFWDYRPEPDYIDASCGVIDIPLNLRFYALNGSRHRVFLSGGLSSYLMRSEDYTLVYTSGQWYDYTYEVRNENHHLFAIYNLSAGYERNFAGRWALQLEPFVKIPARGVGIGSVKLNSVGAFIHLKYKIDRLGK